MPAPISLYLVRHGVAAERGEAWPDDSKRPLVQRGVVRLRQAAAALTRLNVTFDVVLTSPLTRARQTADLLAGGIAGRPAVHTIDSLSPGGSYAAFLEDLARHGRRSHIACVGHEPDLGQFAARLLGAKRPIEFKKGAICRIDVDALPLSGPGHLRWFVTPRMLRRIAR
jgi:phosphohistidine phosphatase